MMCQYRLHPPNVIANSQFGELSNRFDFKVFETDVIVWCNVIVASIDWIGETAGCGTCVN